MNRFVLGDDTGLGKTIEAIGALTYIFEKTPNKKVVILTDKSAVKQWDREFTKFTTGINTFVVDGSADKRSKIYDKFKEGTGPCVLITNYRKVVVDFSIFKTFEDFIFINDECTAYKSPTSQTHQACEYLAQKSSRVWGLTATVIKNNLLEGFGIYKIICPGLFPPKHIFIKAYTMHYMQSIPGTRRKVAVITGYKQSHIEMFKLKIDPYFLGRPKHEVASELPVLTIKDISIELNSDQERLYNEALTGLLRVGEEDKETTQLTAIIYCQQIVNHPLLIEREGDSVKLEKLEDLLIDGEFSDEKIIVFSRFKKMVNIIVPRLNLLKKNPEYCVQITGDDKEEERSEAMLKFQDFESKTKVICITMAGSQAINLQSAKAIIFFDSPWSAGDYLQVLGRMIRIGSIHDKVYAIHLVTSETIDERVMKVLSKKLDLIESVLGKRLKDESTKDIIVQTDNDLSDLFAGLKSDALKKIGG
jgi:SWI/SNF-related matrix-associated actin-dependent regulator of chromatin subfamily A member 5